MATTATTIDTSQVTSTNTSISASDTTPDIDTANLLYQDNDGLINALYQDSDGTGKALFEETI
jgi:hypothetical protein